MWDKIEKRYEIVKHFNKFGMLLTRICGNDECENSYKDPFETWDYMEQTESFLMTRNWDEATGIGLQLGHNGYRAIDIDNVMCSKKYYYFIPQEFDYLSRREMIFNCLSLLGLPSNYEWVVKSPHGYHIIIKTDDVNNMHDSVAYLPNSLFKENDAQQLSFSRMELLWRSHLVLAPSKANHNYTRYRFYNCVMPKRAPQLVQIGNVDNLLNYYCGHRGFANKLDTGYDSFDFNGAHFFMAQIKKRTCRGSLEDMYYSPRRELFAFDGLDNNISWLKACATRESYNKLGVIAFTVRNAPEDAKKFFEASNSIHASYNLACLIALGAVKGSVSDMMQHLMSVSIEKQYKDELRVIYYHKHRQKTTNLFFAITTSALKEEAKQLEICNEQPKILELSWIETDSNLNVTWSNSIIFNHKGYITPLRITQAGGAYHEFVKNFGTDDLCCILLEFAKRLSEATNIICHDAQFSMSILHSYFMNLDFTYYGDNYPISDEGQYKEVICLKKTAVSVMKESYGYEIEPPLADLYEYITGDEYGISKDARYNADCIFKIYSTLKRRKVDFKTFRLENDKTEDDLPF